MATTGTDCDDIDCGTLRVSTAPTLTEIVEEPETNELKHDDNLVNEVTKSLTIESDSSKECTEQAILLKSNKLIDELKVKKLKKSVKPSNFKFFKYFFILLG